MNKGQLAVRLKEEGQSYEEIVRLMNLKDTNSARRLVAEARDSYQRRSIGRKHIFIPDPQCGPGDNLDHLLWAGRYIAEQRPDVLVNAGDHWHMESLSSYETRGSKFMEGRRYKEDVAAGNQGLELMEEGLDGFTPEMKILLRGNHEARIIRAVNEEPKLEGVIGYHDFNDVELGWEPHEFLEPIKIDGLTYAHYFINPANGRPIGGNIDNRLRAVGFSFVAGHQQGLQWGRRELTNGVVQIGLVAGSFYQKNEHYRGPQAKSEWRGLCVLHEVENGSYDPLFVSMNYLRMRYA